MNPGLAPSATGLPSGVTGPILLDLWCVCSSGGSELRLRTPRHAWQPHEVPWDVLHVKSIGLIHSSELPDVEAVGFRQV